MTFIPQFHIGVLLQILCVFSEHLLTLGECLYIWSIMYVLRSFISINEGFRIFYILIFRSPAPLFRPLRLLNSWSSSGLPPFIKTPRLFGTSEYVLSVLFMCVQCYLFAFSVIYVRTMLYSCTYSDIYVLSIQFKCLQVKLIMQNDV